MVTLSPRASWKKPLSTPRIAGAWVTFGEVTELQRDRLAVSAAVAASAAVVATAGAATRARAARAAPARTTDDGGSCYFRFAWSAFLLRGIEFRNHFGRNFHMMEHLRDVSGHPTPVGGGALWDNDDVPDRDDERVREPRPSSGRCRCCTASRRRAARSGSRNSRSGRAERQHGAPTGAHALRRWSPHAEPGHRAVRPRAGARGARSSCRGGPRLRPCPASAPGAGRTDG